MTNKILEGKVALITGSGRGIGKEIALRLASDGADIVVHYSHSEAGAVETVAAIQALGRKAIAVQANIAHRPEVKAMFSEMDKHFEQLDIVVNCAGASAGGTLSNLDDDMLVPDSDEDDSFEEGADELGQDDLDSLFDEEDLTDTDAESDLEEFRPDVIALEQKRLPGSARAGFYTIFALFVICYRV